MQPVPMQERPVVVPKKIYIAIRYKFWISQIFSLAWVTFSVWISIPWIHGLSAVVGKVIAITIITGLAYIPGYLNGFLVISLLLDKQPPFLVTDPDQAVTILIAARNEAERMEQTLRYIAQQDYRGPIMVLIVDNGSTDGTVDVVEHAALTHSLSIRCMRETRLGKNHALNAGLEHVSTDLVITLDADTLLHPSAVRHLIARLESAPAEVCAVAGAVLAKNSRQSFWAKLQEWDYFLGIASVKRLQGLYQSTLVAQGAFSLYKTTAVQSVGGWPDAIGEDIVLTWRFFEHGWSVYFEPLAVAFTDVPDALKHFVRQRSRWARGMVEGLKTVHPWNQPKWMTKFLTGLDLFVPYTDLAYSLCWIPGLILACFGVFWIVGPLTVLVLPLTLLSNLILYRYQKKVFNHLGLRVRKNMWGFVAYVLLYQMLMSPTSIWGYTQEVLKLRRVWK